MVTFAALALLALALHRATRFIDDPGEHVLAVTSGTLALACGLMGLLSALSPRTPAPAPLRFGEVSVLEEHVSYGRARPSLLLAAAAGVLALSLAVRAPRRKRRRWRLDRRMWIVALAALPYVLTAVSGWRSTARGYDALWYHLPQAVAFLRDHHLSPPGRDLVFYFPANGEVWAALLAAILGPRALSLAQWPCAVLAALAAWTLARALGMRRGAPMAAALVLAAPMLVFQSQLAYVDVTALFALAAAAVMEVRAVRAATAGRAAGFALFGGLALGTMIGAKLAGLFWTASLLPPLAIWALFPDGSLRRPRWGRATLILGLTGLAALVPSLFWYARNFRLTGNPLFPVAVPALGWGGLFNSTDFNPGKELELVAARWQWWLYPWLERVSHESGFGAAFAALVPIGAGAAAVQGIRRIARGRLSTAGLPLTWGALGLIAWWVMTPHEARHLMPLLILWGAPSLVLFEDTDLGRFIRPAATAAIAFTVVVTVRALLRSPSAELSARKVAFAENFDLPPFLTRLIPPGARVVNRAGRPMNFALLGPDLDWRLRDYTPTEPAATDLDYLGADYLVYRGPESRQPQLRRLQRLGAAPVRNFELWDSHPGDEVIVYKWLPSDP